MSIHLVKHWSAAFRRVASPIVTVDAVAAGVPQTIIAGLAGGRPPEPSGAEGARRLCALLRGARVRPLRQKLPSSAGPLQDGPAGFIPGDRAGPLAGPGRRE